MMRHGSGKSASNTGAEDSTRAADGFWANPATDTGGAGESPNTKNDAKDGAGHACHAWRVAGWISGGAPPQERGAKRPEDRAWRSLCSHGALPTQTARPDFCMNNPCSTVFIQGQRAIRINRKVCSPRVARFRRICIVLRGFAV